MVDENYKLWYEKNKDKHRERRIANGMYKKYECMCGGRYVYMNKKNHEKTKKHQIHLSSQKYYINFPLSDTFLPKKALHKVGQFWIYING
jgi:hypothetical protein